MADKFKDEKGNAPLIEHSDVYVTGLSDGSDPSLLEVTVVARAVDDGMIYATETTWEHETKESNVHKITDSLRRTKENVAHKYHHLKDTVKTNVNHASLGVKTTATTVTDTVKREVIAVDRKVKANPYIYAAGAVGVGFLLGRIFLATRKAKAEARVQNLVLNDYQAGMNEHTGIHVRDQSRFA